MLDKSSNIKLIPRPCLRQALFFATYISGWPRNIKLIDL